MVLQSAYSAYIQKLSSVIHMVLNPSSHMCWPRSASQKAGFVPMQGSLVNIPGRISYYTLRLSYCFIPFNCDCIAASIC
jgi:hypothetical protein